MMQYGLRTNIHLNTWPTFLPELIRFCKEAHIDEVLLSEESYYIATVLQSEEYFHKIADAYCQIVPMLRAEGITPSFYIKVSMGHYEGDVPDVPDFVKFVGQDLVPAPTTPCGMDRRWQEYISRICADCARAGFDRLYLDDDFRSVNHFEGRTGCFCELHVKATSEKCGIPLTPETLLKHVCGNSPEDRLVRAAWMDVNFANQLETGRMVEKAVHAVCPQTQIGLMCCGDSGSSVQGRDMAKLLRAFAGEGRPILARPAGGAYSDTLLSGVDEMYLGTARFISIMPEDLMAVSEVDSYPRTVMSKSVRQTDMHIQLHALAGAKQATLNLFDHFETPFTYCQEYADMLRDRRELYDRVEKLREGRKPFGVHILWKWDMARHMDTLRPHVNGLYPHYICPDPAQMLSRMGVPVAFGEGEINYIDGDVVNALSREEIERMVRKPLMLDMFAARKLCELGYGEDIGLSDPQFVDVGCYECFDVDGFDGNCHGQYVAAYGRNVGDSIHRPSTFTMADGVWAASHLIDLDKKPFAPATYLYENRHGARICTFACPIVPDRNWYYKCRAGQVRAIVKWLMKGAETWTVENGLNVMPIVLKGETDTVVALVNPSLDDATPVLDTASTFTDAITGEAVDLIDLPGMAIKYFKA